MVIMFGSVLSTAANARLYSRKCTIPRKPSNVYVSLRTIDHRYHIVDLVQVVIPSWDEHPLS